MKKQKIRPIALLVALHNGKILVQEATDSVKGERFYRPLGGGIEFGERGEDAIVREIHEEIGADLVNVRFLAMIENLFTYQGKPGHEIVLLYTAAFADPTLYGRDRFIGNEGGDPFSVVWLPLADARESRAILYPVGLLYLLEADKAPNP